MIKRVLSSEELNFMRAVISGAITGTEAADKMGVSATKVTNLKKAITENPCGRADCAAAVRSPKGMAYCMALNEAYKIDEVCPFYRTRKENIKAFKRTNKKDSFEIQAMRRRGYEI